MGNGAIRRWRDGGTFWGQKVRVRMPEVHTVRYLLEERVEAVRFDAAGQTHNKRIKTERHSNGFLLTSVCVLWGGY